MTPDNKTRLSDRDFAELGAPALVYIREVVNSDGRKAFNLHAANGDPLASLPSFPEAVMVARTNELYPVSVH